MWRLCWLLVLFGVACGDSMSAVDVDALSEHAPTPVIHRDANAASSDLNASTGRDTLGSATEADDAGTEQLRGPDVDTGQRDAEVQGGDTSQEWCPQDVVCVSTFPTVLIGDTVGGGAEFDSYACKPGSDQSGPERVYRLDVEVSGFLNVAVWDDDGVDVDVHILSARDPESCVARGHHQASVDVSPGTWWVVVDSYTEGARSFAGAYRLEIGLYQPSEGPCGMEVGEMPRVGDGGETLVMPATGPMVMEAHLVTQEEPEPYPSTATEELEAHFVLSQSVTGFVMFRQQVWAPLEGGNFYGCGIGSPALFPVLDEGWYVNMYWTSQARPPRGTRMIVRQPNSQRAVVVAAGYETGPGNLANIGGTTEETHYYLGSSHKSVLALGIAEDQSLPLGPRRCTP